jgi:hypothetical protein
MENKITVLSVSEINKIIFSEVLETNTETLRLNVAETKTFIKYKTEPSFIKDLETAEGPYDSQEFSDILQTEEWTNYNIIVPPQL